MLILLHKGRVSKFPQGKIFWKVSLVFRGFSLSPHRLWLSWVQLFSLAFDVIFIFCQSVYTCFGRDVGLHSLPLYHKIWVSGILDCLPHMSPIIAYLFDTLITWNNSENNLRLYTILIYTIYDSMYTFGSQKTCIIHLCVFQI
jgi:hypothetical protein